MADNVEACGSSVYFKIPRRKDCTLFNLKEEVDFRKELRQESDFVEAICGIVGAPNSGRKLLGDRFGRINEGDIDCISDDKQVCYSGNFNMVLQGRPIQALIKAYIIPPPPGNENPKKESKKDSEKDSKKKSEELPTAVYLRASHEFCCLLLAFDVTKMSSFYAARESLGSMKITLPKKYFLVGNKCDLRGNVRNVEHVPQEFARAEAKKMGAADYFECSAKLNINVRSIMEAVVRCENDQPHV